MVLKEESTTFSLFGREFVAGFGTRGMLLCKRKMRSRPEGNEPRKTVPAAPAEDLARWDLAASCTGLSV